MTKSIKTHFSLSVTHANGHYPIIVDTKITNLMPFIKGTQALIVTDENVASHYLATIQNQLKTITCDRLILPAGEEHKTLQTFSQIIDHCVSHQHHRDTTFIALGGGVINDITGFAAACYHRGVSWIAIPTTLLAQVDASVGGKTAVNHSAGKNLIGAFHPPATVFINTQTLNTLPDREFRSGIAEIIKVALISDNLFFSWLEENREKLISRDKKTLSYAIKRSIEIKCNIVMQDEKEKNVRMLLNFGHTLAHAIEANHGFSNWLHGEAVAYGMLFASILSHQQNQLNQSELNRIYNLLTQFGFIKPLAKHVALSDLIHFMQNDKKTRSQQLRFILLEKIGSAIIADHVTIPAITLAWDEIRSKHE